VGLGLGDGLAVALPVEPLAVLDEPLGAALELGAAAFVVDAAAVRLGAALDVFAGVRGLCFAGGGWLAVGPPGLAGGM
jgi:hypothetical protein